MGYFPPLLPPSTSAGSSNAVPQPQTEKGSPMVLPSGVPRTVVDAGHSRSRSDYDRMMAIGNARMSQAAAAYEEMMGARRKATVQPSMTSKIVNFFRRLFGLNQPSKPKPVSQKAANVPHQRYQESIININRHRNAGRSSDCQRARRGLALAIAGDIGGRMMHLTQAYNRLITDSSQQAVIENQELAFKNLLEYASEGAVADNKEFKNAVAEFRSARRAARADHFINQFSVVEAQFFEKVRLAKSQGQPPPISALREFAGAVARLEQQIPQFSTKTISTNLDERMERWHPVYKNARDKLRKAQQENDAPNALTHKKAVKNAEKQVKKLRAYLIDKSPELSDQAFAQTKIHDARLVLMRGVKIHLEDLGKNLTATEKTIFDEWTDKSWIGYVGAILRCELDIRSVAQAGNVELPPGFSQKTKELIQQIDASAKARYRHFKPMLRDFPTDGIEDLLRFQLDLKDIPNPSRTIQQLLKAVATDIDAINKNRQKEGLPPITSLPPVAKPPPSRP